MPLFSLYKNIFMTLQELLKGKIQKNGGVQDLLKFLKTYILRVDSKDRHVFKNVTIYYKLLHLVDVDVAFHATTYVENVEMSKAVFEKYYKVSKEPQLKNILSYIDFCQQFTGTKKNDLSSGSGFLTVSR